MTNTVTITADQPTSLDANSANTTYIINEGVDIAPPSDIAIDARAGAMRQSFEINGHLSGTDGIIMGEHPNDTAHSKIVVGLTGVITAVNVGMVASGDHNQLINHGKIYSDIGIMSFSVDTVINNTGTIVSKSTGTALYGDNTNFSNSGTISGTWGVMEATFKGESSTFHNTGKVTGVAGAVLMGQGEDYVSNSGILKGNVYMGGGNDHFDDAGGRVIGIVDGGEGKDVLKGGGKIDALSGGEGSDVLTGRGGADVFYFATSSGGDTVTDFDAKGAGHDILNLFNMKGFDSFADLAGHMHQDGNDAVLHFGHGDVLTLHNVDFHDLSKADFLF